ncbi:hypothetical protein SH591_04855 [Sphingomonas sp. LY54]|uniref:hypothetical protein n=1 Tax=Sphingomonas sp. LY54 TaxID=3095343 RepID=UPI002D78FFC8|nr:hypothetical protein [Sphingomonas sp. LY54]WRP29515.1 hypothetical protein SH591_04855 [Sphingomonas sp. LY54]
MDENSTGPAKTVNYLVRIARDHDVHEVANELRGAGLEIERELPGVGVVGGHGDPAIEESLRSFPGVAEVRQEGTFQLPPMNDDVPQ